MPEQNISGYELSRKWFDFCFENQDRINVNHTALYMWYLEKWNRSGHVQKLSITTSESMMAIGIKNHNTYSKTLKDLIEFGFIEMVKKSFNQYQCNIISLSQKSSKQSKKSALDKSIMLSQKSSKQSESIDKAPYKATVKHHTKQSESIDSINKPLNQETIKPINQETTEDIFSLKNSQKNFEEIKMPFTSENFRVLWQNWKSYRHQEFKKKYKSIQSEQAALSHLAKISGGNEQTATEIISLTIANQWQGLFELKNKQNGAYQNNHRNGAEVSTSSAFSKIDSMPDKT